MGKVIEAAISSRPWCAGGTLFDLDDVLDDEGRPVNERRAPSRVKEGVVIELKSCPYHDERKGKPMNVSALAQVTRHLDQVVSDLARFRATPFVCELAWQSVLMNVVDQLARPALHLLKVRDANARVPAQCAVGHKLAAGFFGVVDGLLSDEIEGAPWPVSVESLLSYAREHHLLIGASEVCAGPPPLIEKASHALVAERGHADARPSEDRVRFAHLVTQQISLGTAWESHDLFVERALMQELLTAPSVTPKNQFLASEIERRRRELIDTKRMKRGLRVPRLPDASYAPLSERMANAEADPTLTKALLELLRGGQSALSIPEEYHPGFAERFVCYLQVYQGFSRAQWQLEQRVREALGYDPGVPMRPNVLVLPRSRALRWFEAGLGYRLQTGLPPDFGMCLGNPRKKVKLTLGEDKVRRCGT